MMNYAVVSAFSEEKGQASHLAPDEALDFITQSNDWTLAMYIFKTIYV